MRPNLTGSTLLLCVFTLAAILGGCTSKEEPPLSPVLKLEPTRTPLPKNTQGPPPPSPTPRPVKVLLPGWLDKTAKGKVIAKVQEGLKGRPLTVVASEDPDASKSWDLGLVAVGRSGVKAPDQSPWLSDSLHLFANKSMLKQHGITELGSTWQQVLETCTAHPRGASDPPILILPGDLPGLPRTLQNLAMLAGANSESKLDSKPVAIALDFLYQLHGAHFFPVGSRNGTSLSFCLKLMGEAHCGLTLGWETESGWIADPKRSPSGSRIEVLDPPCFGDQGQASASPVTRLWCWQAKDSSLSPLALDLARFNPGPEVGGRWIGGITDTSQIPVPSDLFILDARPGQDFRDTARIIQDGWSHGTPAAEILKGLEVRYTSALSK
jgi:hypothetical protein